MATSDDDDVVDEEEAAEGLRLLHVAFTRARDLLFVSYAVDKWSSSMAGKRLTRAIAQEDVHDDELFEVRSGLAPLGSIEYWDVPEHTICARDRAFCSDMP